MSTNSENSSDSSDPSESTDQEDSDYSPDTSVDKQNSKEPQPNEKDETQNDNSESSNYTSNKESTTSDEPNQNVKKSSENNSEKAVNSQSSPDSDSDSELKSKEHSESDSESKDPSDSDEKSSNPKNKDTEESASKSDSESHDSTDSDENIVANKEVKPEPKSESKSTSETEKSSDSESVPTVKNVTVNSTKTPVEGKSNNNDEQKAKSELESIYKSSTSSDDESKDTTDSDSERKPTNQKTSSSKSQKETDDNVPIKEKSVSVSKNKKNKNEQTQDSTKSTKDDKSSSRKSKKSTNEEKATTKHTTKRRSKLSEDTKDDENASKKSKKSISKRSRHQSRKIEASDNDDDYEYDNDSENDHKRKKSSKSKNEPTSQMSAEELDEAFEREDAIIDAVYLFNTRKIVSKLCAYFNTEETPEGIAHVIRTTKGLNGEIIGDYLGKKENSKILSAYFMEVDMKCGYIEAMRRSLSGPMFLPGEGQIIDRILQEFANCYVAQNPGKYSNADELYVLSFALVMLNSDLHNRNVQNRMTVKEFIRNTRHLLSADDVTDKELTEMYNEIQSTPFSFTNHTNDFWWEVAPKIRGYLQKKSEHSLSKWTKKYFVLTNSCLYYFKDDNPANEGKPLGVIQLTEVEVAADSKDPLMIKITAANDEISYVKFKKIPKAVKGIKKISFKAPDRASASRWLHRIKKSAIMSNFLDKINDNNNIDPKM